MNLKELARVGAKARLAVLMKEIRMLVRMFPGIADEESGIAPKKRKGVKWSAARRKAQSERMKKRNPKHLKERHRRDNASGPGN